MRLQKIDVKRKCRNERPAKTSRFRRNHVVMDAKAMKNTQDGKQRQEQWANTGEAQQVKVTYVDAGKRTPSPYGRGRDQKPGDGKENLYAILPVPHQRRHQLFRYMAV